MITKKKTLIELMLDGGIKPEDINKRIEYFVSDEPQKTGESCISGYSIIPEFMEKSNEFHYNGYIDSLCKTPYHPENQGNQIITKQQFIDAYEAHEKFKALAPIPVQNCKCAVTLVLSNSPEKESKQTSKSDGSTASYYELPEDAKELQDLISHHDMNSQIGEIFRACYRYGLVEHSDKLRDAKKIKFYAEAEIKRLEKLQK